MAFPAPDPLAGKVAVVTGASKGIGRAIAVGLARRGVTVVAVGRDADQLTEVSAVTGGSSLTCELREDGSAERVVAHALKSHGRLDILVANAGLGFAGEVGSMSADKVAELVEVNVTSPLQLARCCLEPMLAQGSGTMLFVTSIAGALGVPGESVYSATKAAVEMFADVLREEVRDRGIEVTTLLPGVVDTGFFERRGLPYDRAFPRPMAAEKVARAAIELLAEGGRRRVVPRWLGLPVWLRSAAPSFYRALERRFG